MNNKLISLLKSSGASLVGFTDLKEIDIKARDGFPYGISIAVALDPHIVSEIREGPTSQYIDECLRVDLLLTKLGELTQEFLRDKGFKVKQQATTNLVGAKYPPKLTTKLPHKTVATRAGLGWIGKNAILITREYGSAIRLGSILTDAGLPGGIPVDTSYCEDCTVCVDVCPAKAITGETWRAGIAREVLVDAYACRKTARKLLINRTGGEIKARTFCGICIATCPWTKKYLERRV